MKAPAVPTVGLVAFALSLLCVSSFAQEVTCVRDLPYGYVPGRTMTVTIRATRGDFPAGLYGLDETIPEGWSYEGADMPFVVFDDEMHTVRMRWYGWDPWYCPPGMICIPPKWGPPSVMSYQVTPPLDEKGEVFFKGLFSVDGSQYAPTTGDSIILDIHPVRYRPSWATIQATIDNALWGDTVVITRRDTPFLESIKMKPGVNLAGSVEWPDWQLPVIESDSSLPATVAAAHTRISGLTIRSSSVGIRVQDPTVEISDCVITSTEIAAIDYSATTTGRVTNCTIADNAGAGVRCREPSPEVVVSNSIFFRNDGPSAENCTVRYCLLEDAIQAGTGENCIMGDPMFADPAAGDYRLLRGSPCIDAGINAACGSSGKDLLNRPRIMFGGESEAVDLGAFEHWFISASRQAGTSQVRLSWASQAGKTYSVLFSDDLTLWQTADDNVSADGMITNWMDSGSGPSALPMRFCRVMENE